MSNRLIFFMSQSFKYANFIIIGLFYTNITNAIYAEEVLGFSPSSFSNSALVDLSSTYAYEPSAIRGVDQTLNIWSCGGDVNGNYADSIYYTKIPSDGNTPPTTKVVLRPRNNDIAEDGRHTCHPGVIRRSHPWILGGKNLYLLYYECAPQVYDRSQTGLPLVEAYTQICFAISEDGEEWQRYNEDLWNSSQKFGDDGTNPTPVVKVDPLVHENCDYQTINGKKTIDLSLEQCANPGSFLPNINNYGVGHPSPIIVNNQIWLFYYDSKGDWDDHGVYLAKSWDGFHFDPPVKTNLPNSATVKYLKDSSSGLPNQLIAMSAVGKDNVIFQSTDGLNWNLSGEYGLQIGTVNPARCPAAGPGAIIGDKEGAISSYQIDILSAEGFYSLAENGPELGCYSQLEDQSRGSTWKIYLMKGEFKLLSSDQSIFPGNFSVNDSDAIYYSNGNDQYCSIYSWEFYLWGGGNANLSNLNRIGRFTDSMVYVGSCATPSIPAGLFSVEADTVVYYSNGQNAYCRYNSSTTNLLNVSGIYPNMAYHGDCQ